jgi:ABC-type antimicrobial peptide transport system permease subunit
VRDTARELDPLLPVYQIETIEQILSRSPAVYRRQSALVLIAVFAIAAVGLAVVGLYGLLAHTVARRTRELGIRIALGADRTQVMRAVLARAAALIAAGTAVGALISLVSARALETLLFRVGTVDAATLAAAAGVVAGISLLACLWPARRAVRIDPASALRGDW